MRAPAQTPSRSIPFMLIFEPLGSGYEVNGLQAPLAGIPFPSTEFIANLHPRFEWIVCLSSVEPEKRYSSGKLQWLEKIKIESPLTGEKTALAGCRDAAAQVHRKIAAGEGVAIHCDMGIERTGSVIGTVLALHGFKVRNIAREIADIINEQQPGWTSGTFTAELEVAIGRCVALR